MMRFQMRRIPCGEPTRQITFSEPICQDHRQQHLRPVETCIDCMKIAERIDQAKRLIDLAERVRLPKPDYGYHSPDYKGILKGPRNELGGLRVPSPGSPNEPHGSQHPHKPCRSDPKACDRKMLKQWRAGSRSWHSGEKLSSR